MSGILFKTGGPLTSEHASLYIERQADSEVLNVLRNPQAMDYLLIIEPRQQGKTSLIGNLMRHWALRSFIFAYLDLEDFDYADETDWYAGLWNELAWQCNSLCDFAKLPIPTCTSEWREHMKYLANCARQAQQRLIIILDEIESIKKNHEQAWSRTFFAAIRKLYNLRIKELSLNYITFVLMGVFHPRDLIPDGVTSPFNIAQRVRLADFNVEQVRELVGKGGWQDEQASALSQRIYYWTDGQPYLTQLLCSYLGLDATPTDVDAGVERVQREDQNHLSPLLERLSRDRKLCEYVDSIRRGKRVKFYPQQDRQQAQLELLGIIKKDSDGYCVVRNRVYERALGPQLCDGFQYDVFVSYSHKDGDWVQDTLLPHLEAEGLRVCIDYRDFDVGAPSVVNMENAVEHSRKTLLMLTPNWVASEWTEFEGLLARTKDPAGHGRRILPLMVQRCTLPNHLQAFTYLDLTNPAQFDFQMKRLVAAIRSAPQPPAAIETTPTQRPMARDFSHENGLAALGGLLAQADTQVRLNFTVLESRLLDNLQDEHYYGVNPIIRSERARIMEELNKLALKYVERSFNDLCRIR